MGGGYQKFQAGSPDGYLDFGVISRFFYPCILASTTGTIDDLGGIVVMMIFCNV